MKPGPSVLSDTTMLCLIRKRWLFSCVLCILFIWIVTYKHLSQDKLSSINSILSWNSSVSAQLSSSAANSRLLINTTGCKLEYIAPFDDRYPETKKFFKPIKPLNCKMEIPPLTSLQHGVLKVDTQVLTKHYSTVKECYYKPFGRDKNDNNWVLFGKQRRIDLHGENKIEKDDFIVVECISANNTIIHRDIHKQIAPRLNWEGKPFPKRGSDDYSSILIVLESTSRLNWMRQVPKVHEYITSVLGGIVFNGHNKVADNTAVNLYPMVTGRHLADDWKTLVLKSVDDFPWIWKEAERKGYVTLIAEEASGTKRPKWVKDFKNSPAYHFHRPVRLYRNKVKTIPHNPLRDVCYGSKSTLGSLFDWILEFQMKYKEVKRASALVMSSQLLTHDDVNGLSSKEHIFIDFFKRLNAQGVLDNSFLIVVGDHGLRVGDYFNTKAGAYEARLPMLIMVPPKRFKEQYPRQYSNLVVNAQNRLTSHFDIWRTFKYFINKEFLNPSSVEKTKYGLSLMEPIPEERDCEGAGVPSHWCACGSYVVIPKDDIRARKAGEILISSINKKTSVVRDFCVAYSDFLVTEVKLKVPSNDIVIVIETTPVRAIFRSTISLGENQPLITAMERLDSFGSKSWCITEHKFVDMVLLKLCTCHNVL